MNTTVISMFICQGLPENLSHLSEGDLFVPWLIKISPPYRKQFWDIITTTQSSNITIHSLPSSLPDTSSTSMIFNLLMVNQSGHVILKTYIYDALLIFWLEDGTELLPIDQSPLLLESFRRRVPRFGMWIWILSIFYRSMNLEKISTMMTILIAKLIIWQWPKSVYRKSLQGFDNILMDNFIIPIDGLNHLILWNTLPS